MFNNSDYIRINRNYQSLIQAVNSNWWGCAANYIGSRERLQNFKNELFSNCDTSKPHYPVYIREPKSNTIDTRFSNSSDTLDNLIATLRQWVVDSVQLSIRTSHSINLFRDSQTTTVCVDSIKGLHNLLCSEPILQSEGTNGFCYMAKNNNKFHLPAIFINSDLLDRTSTSNNSLILYWITYKISSCYICKLSFKLYYRYSHFESYFNLDSSDHNSFANSYNPELFELVMCNKCFSAENLLPSHI